MPTTPRWKRSGRRSPPALNAATEKAYRLVDGAMSERWARAMLSAYRFAGSAAYPLVGTYVALARQQGQGRPQPAARERYGIAGKPRPDGPMIWVHAASVGETIAIMPLIERILDFGVNVVLTTGTVTSAQVADERLGDRVIHQYVPLDLKPAVSRFLDHWQPDLAIIAESEIWPMTILELGAPPRSAGAGQWPAVGPLLRVMEEARLISPRRCSRISRMSWRNPRSTASGSARWARGR